MEKKQSDNILSLHGDEKKKKVFRSIIKELFPVELLIKIDEISRQHDIDNNSKTPEIIELLHQYNVPFEPLGNGTNRYGILVNGYVVKIALDRMGKIDNQREFKYSKMLYPSVVKVYECATTGLVATFEYVTIFTLDDFYSYQEEMRPILREISENFLVGDIGISTDNYVNWGIRNDESICILDFAYIYSLSYKGFKCTCEDEGTLQFDNDFVFLKCPMCGKKWSFSDIRKRISKADEINEIGDISKIGYILHKSEEILVENPEFSPHDFKKPKKNRKDKHNNHKGHTVTYDTSEEGQKNALEKLNNIMEEYKNEQEKKTHGKQNCKSRRSFGGIK